MRRSPPALIAALCAAVYAVPAGAEEYGLFPEGGGGGLTRQIREVSPLARSVGATVRPADPSDDDGFLPRVFAPPRAADPPAPFDTGTGGWLGGAGDALASGWDGLSGGLGRLGGSAGVVAPPNWSARFMTIGGDGFGLDSFEARGSYRLTDFPPVTLSPSFGTAFLDGPHTDRSDLPPRLYTAGAEVTLAFPLGTSGRWVGRAAVAPGLLSDLDNTSGDAFRLPARVAATYRQSERTQYVVGLAFLDREDIPWLPVGGVVHRLTPNTKLELTLPRPRVVWRLWEGGGSLGLGYVVGELGGGSFGVVRRGGREDIATLRDYRLLVGLEVKNADGSAWLVEGGGVFGRELEFDRGPGDRGFASSGLLRVGLGR